MTSCVSLLRLRELCYHVEQVVPDQLELKAPAAVTRSVHLLQVPGIVQPPTPPDLPQGDCQGALRQQKVSVGTLPHGQQSVVTDVSSKLHSACRSKARPSKLGTHDRQQL